MAAPTDEELASELDRAVTETRSALGDLAKRGCLSAALMGLSTMIDRVDIALTGQPGESAFELFENADGEAVHFRVAVIRKVVIETEGLIDEIGNFEGDERRRACQLAVNLLLVHELMHIRQNFPHFATVSKIKSGLPVLGLPILDVAADVMSAWVCAHVEAARLGSEGEREVLPYYVNALVLSYVIGSFVFDVRENPAKRQRALGLIVSAVLVQAQIDGRLVSARLLDSWRPISPVLILDVEKCHSFNALVIEAMAGLLLPQEGGPSDLALEFWKSAGIRPILKTLKIAGMLLRSAGAVK